MKKVYDGLDIGEFTDNLIVWFKLMTVAEFLNLRSHVWGMREWCILSFPARRGFDICVQNRICTHLQKKIPRLLEYNVPNCCIYLAISTFVCLPQKMIVGKSNRVIVFWVHVLLDIIQMPDKADYPKRD